MILSEDGLWSVYFMKLFFIDIAINVINFTNSIKCSMLI